MNIGLVYNSDVRNNGTPVHFWHAFKQLRIPMTRYSPKGTLPKHDFYIYIDDGRDDLTWKCPSPCGYYATDTHLGWDYRRWKAEQFDLVWCAQKPAAERMTADGLHASWLPLGANPIAHPTAQELRERFQNEPTARFYTIPEKVYDVGFVGYLQPPHQTNRIAFLDQIFAHFPSFHIALGVFHEDMAHIYHASKIGINHAVRDDLNMRFFELASIGVPQLCDRRMIGLRDLGFQETAHYIGYASVEEGIAQIQRGLDQPDWLESMAECALAAVRAKHTYVHRVSQMMHDISEFMGQERDDILTDADRSVATSG